MREYDEYEMKADGEKLLRVFLRRKKGRIETVLITGDFFIIPEEGIEIIESALVGVEIDEPAIRTHIDLIVTKNIIDLVGISAMSMSHAIVMAAANHG